MLWLASLMVTFVTDYTMLAETRVGVPSRGGSLWIDWKREQQETQFVIFQLDPWEFFKRYPQDHVYVLMDASLPGGNVPYTGRGVIASKHGDALVFWFEDFRTQALTYAFSMPVTDGPFEVEVHANRDGLAVWAGGRSSGRYQWTLMPSNNQEKVSVVIVGGTHDFSGPDRPAAQIVVKDLRMGRFVP